MSDKFINLNPDNYWMLNWLDLYLTGHNGFVCGGCFKNILNKEKVKDIDIFFRSEEDWANAVRYFIDNPEYEFFYENSKVKAYKNKKTDIRVELCRSIFGEPEDILKNFDFTITKFAYYKKEVVQLVDNNDPFDSEDYKESTHIETRIICVETFFEHLHLKRLVIDDQIPYPMSTFERVLRYAKYGYSPCKETKIKLAKAISELPTEAIEASRSLYDGVD